MGYALAMTDTELDIDEDEREEDLGPSLAFPPLYVLRTAERCPECGLAQHVYALGCTAFRFAEEGGEPVDLFHFLRVIRSVPKEVTTLLKRKCPRYFLDKDEVSGETYFMNHCRCGARLDDHFVHSGRGAAFMPDTPEGYEHITLFRLPIGEPIEIECCFTLGGGEYLNVAQAEAW